MLGHKVKNVTSFRIFPNENTQGLISHFTIVDDEEGLLHVWARLLSLEMNCSAFLTTEPKEAFQEVKQGRTDVLITDLLMPGMNGIELAKLVKTYSPHTRIVFTTSAMNQFEKLLSDGEVSEVVKKPYLNVANIQSFLKCLTHKQPPQEFELVQEGRLRIVTL